MVKLSRAAVKAAHAEPLLGPLAKRFSYITPGTHLLTEAGHLSHSGKNESVVNLQRALCLRPLLSW